MQNRRDWMDVSSSCFQQCLAAESVAWTSLSLSLTPSPWVEPPPTPAPPRFTWAKLNRLVNRWSHSADAAIIKHLDFYLWFIFLARYISYGALVWTYVAPPTPPTALSEVCEPVKGCSLPRRTSNLVISCLHQPSKPTPRCWRGLPRNLLFFPSSSTNTSMEVVFRNAFK